MVTLIIELKIVLCIKNLAYFETGFKKFQLCIIAPLTTDVKLLAKY